MKFREFVFIAVSFGIGFAASQFYSSYLDTQKAQSHKAALKKQLSSDPYANKEQSKQNRAYFLDLLSEEVKSVWQSQFKNQTLSASCVLDFVPGGPSESVLVTTDSKIYVATFKADSPPDKRVQMTKIESQVLDISEDSEWELRCRSGQSVVNHPKFKSESTDLDLLESISMVGRDVILLRSGAAQDYIVFAYSSLESSPVVLGRIPADL
jgi:hypothetical protein